MLVETRLGVPLEDALEGVATRYESKDFGWVVMAIRIQRQVGGNLAELLDTVAGTMREREYIRRQVSALAAEGKLSAMVLAGLPPAFMGYLYMSQRDYVMVLLHRPARHHDPRRLGRLVVDRDPLDEQAREGGGLRCCSCCSAACSSRARWPWSPRPSAAPVPWLGVDRSVAYLEALGAAPEEIRGDLEPPFAERVLAPLRRPGARRRSPPVRCRLRDSDPAQARPGREPPRVVGRRRLLGEGDGGRRAHRGRPGRRAGPGHLLAGPAAGRRPAERPAGSTCRSSSSTSAPTTGPRGWSTSCRTPSTSCGSAWSPASGSTPPSSRWPATSTARSRRSSRGC